jgi:hypothetical protein
MASLITMSARDIKRHASPFSLTSMVTDSTGVLSRPNDGRRAHEPLKTCAGNGMGKSKELLKRPKVLCQISLGGEDLEASVP